MTGLTVPYTLRWLELFAGIGGFATAATRVWGQAVLHVCPLDIDRDAQRVYELNHPHTLITCEIQSLQTSYLQSLAANAWWLSPPCQPYSQRGHQRDIDDPRAQSLLFLIAQIPTLLPKWIALENVAAFAHSRAYQLLSRALLDHGYSLMHRLLCPTEMGWPNRRPRFYLLASRDGLPDWQPLPQFTISVDELIRDAAVDFDQCRVADEVIHKFMTGMDRVDPACDSCVTACFGSSYGKSILHAGSYCSHQGTYRRFSPEEVARLMGFPREFQLPGDMQYRRLWKLLGNSLSIPAVEYVLSHVC